MKLLTPEEIDQLVELVQINTFSNGSGYPLLDTPRMVATLKAQSRVVAEAKGHQECLFINGVCALCEALEEYENGCK